MDRLAQPRPRPPSRTPSRRPNRASGRARPPRRRIRYRKRRLALLVLILLLTPVVYSYTTMMLRPSSLPLGIRSVEWVRANHGAWLVDSVERKWYTWNAVKPGGPVLKTLPVIGHPVVSRPRSVRPVFRPRSLRPVVRPRLPGEGAWHSVGRTVDGAAPLLVTTFRPDPVYPRTVAYVAWIDHRRTQLALYPGRYEPPHASPRGPIQIPPSQRIRLVATFNSGFTYRDGHGGFFVKGQTAEPLRAGQGTVVGYANGRVDVTSWRGGATPTGGIVLARQNLPLIVDQGRPNPDLSDGSLWGATLGNAVRVWRSGVGIDRHGNLIYAAASNQTAQSLAAILVHSGAVRAIELDINTEWPSFIAYPRPGGWDPLKIVPNSQQSANRYLLADDRDFFAVYTRLPGRHNVPFS